MVKFLKYFTLYLLSCRNSLANYKALIGLSIFLITCLVIFAHLWKIAAAKAGGIYFSPSLLLWYIAFNEWILVSIPDTQEIMEHDLRSGRLAYLLPRPISYLGSTFAEAAGSLTVNLIVLGIVTFLFTWFQTGILPFSFTGLLLMFLLGMAATIVAVFFQMAIGLSSFWIHDVAPFHWVWEKLLFMLGGLILPLAVYPKWMQTLAYFTPFPAILSQRSALALNFNFNDLLLLCASLIFWGAFGWILTLLLYRKGLRILNVEGG